MQRKLDPKEQLAVYQRRYQGRGLEGKGRLLDEFCEHYGYERKYAIKLLGGAVGPVILKRSSPGPQPKYRAILEVVEQVWAAAAADAFAALRLLLFAIHV